MRALIQRVSEASVSVDATLVGRIGRGILLLLGVEREDNEAVVSRLCERVLTYRIFPDEHSHMNRSLLDVDGDLLVVPQFTLAADTQKGRRPSFSPAATPNIAEKLYETFVRTARNSVQCVETGKFGADMKVLLVNDGPVTFLLAVAP